MLTDTDTILHGHARHCASQLHSPDKKHLRFNEIVAAAKAFYPGSELSGIIELVKACDRENLDLYYRETPMWKSLFDDYGWMV